MAQQDQQAFPQSTPRAPFVLVCLAITAAAYFGFVRPAQQHMQALERQCSKLAVAVKKLQGKDEIARDGFRLINLLDAQSEKLASAERALDKFTKLHKQIMVEVEEIEQVSVALQQLEAVRYEVDRHGQALATTANTLSEMANVTESIEVSSQITRQANGSLATLGQQQRDFSNSVAKLSQQLTDMQLDLVNRTARLPQAERTLARIDKLCQQLSDEAANITTAKQQLGELAGLKQDVLQQSVNLPAAEAALDQIWDLKVGLLQASSTLTKARQLALDMMLLEPVIDQLAETLKPVADSTRLSRREAAKTPETRQTADANQSSPWSSAINVFVALLGSAQ